MKNKKQKVIEVNIFEPDMSKVRSNDLDYNKGKSCAERGYIEDDRGFYDPGDYERKDEWGNIVTHQDSQTMPRRRFNN